MKVNKKNDKSVLNSGLDFNEESPVEVKPLKFRPISFKFIMKKCLTM